MKKLTMLVLLSCFAFATQADDQVTSAAKCFITPVGTTLCLVEFEEAEPKPLFWGGFMDGLFNGLTDGGGDAIEDAGEVVGAGIKQAVDNHAAAASVAAREAQAETFNAGKTKEQIEAEKLQEINDRLTGNASAGSSI